ncbi:MAG TPA: helix-turn-helix domain-containing protein [Baekduia sp.]|nr:helix-turn-helix domain-containing protein [Baekduia sp.]
MSDSSAFVKMRPEPALRRFVEVLWVHRVAGPPPPGGRRLLPDGRVHLVWIAQLGLRIAGPAQMAMSPPPLDRMLAFGATLYPGVAPYLLRTPASDIVDQHIHVDAIDGRFAAEVDDALLAAPDARAGVAALQRVLARRIAAVDREPDPAVRRAVAVLDSAGATVAGAAAATYVSERELQRRFVHDVGYAPKTLQRVMRLQRFLAQLTLPRIELAGAAALAGYADQSHLSRDARRLAGLSPRQLLDYRH